MSRPFGVIAASAAIGTVSCVTASVLSHLHATGDLSPGIVSAGRFFTTFRSWHQMPVEFFLMTGFTAALLLSLRRFYASVNIAPCAIFALGVSIVGATGGLIVRHPACVGLWVTALCGLGIVLISGLRLEWPAARECVAFFFEDVRHLMHSPLALACTACAALILIVVWQTVANRVAAVSTLEASDRRIVGWFSAQPRIALPELQSRDVRVLIFTDYQCPACGSLIPQYEAVLSAATLSGRKVDLAVRDFALDPECNPMVSAPVHPMACEAAVAVRLTRSTLGDQAAADFGTWLYHVRGPVQKASLLSRLQSLGLAEAFTRQYKALLAESVADAQLGARAGVYSTPTVFVDGVKLPTVTASGLEAVVRCAFERRRTASQ